MPDIAKTKEMCSGCGACSNICPKACIEMEEDTDGFIYPVVDLESCVECKLCRGVCPCLTKPYPAEKSKVYMGHSNYCDIRYNSSSGGIFSELAMAVLADDGIVYGADFDETLELVSASAENAEELARLRASKYVQCSTGDVYLRVKEQAKNGRKVLFCGTPCQVKAMKSFLKESLDNVLLVDFICHGVPSMNTLRKYMAVREKESGKKIVNLKFRDKSVSWESYGMRVIYDDGTDEFFDKFEDYFLRGFLKNLFLRDSCHSCKVKNFTSGSDLTLGDCWRLVGTAQNDHKGESIAICNTEKGEAALGSILGKVMIEVSDLTTEISHNRSAVRSVPQSKNRTEFFEKRNEIQFDKLVKKCTRESLGGKVKRAARTILVGRGKG